MIPLLLTPVAALMAQSQIPSQTPPKTPEPFAPDIVRAALWDGRPMVPFHAVDNPPSVAAKEASTFLNDDEYVLGVTVNGESRAYPTRFVWWHHVVNDTIGGAPIVLTYCSVCNAGIALDPTIDGKPRQLDFFGLYNGVACYVDRASGSVLLAVDHRFVNGPLLGKTLGTRDILDTTWGKWKKLHPETRVMSPDNAYSKAYAPKGQAESRDYKKFPAPFFKPSVTRIDKRLPAFEKVVAVTIGETRRAYPTATLKVSEGPLNDTLGDTPIAVFFDPDAVTAAVVGRELDGKSLTFMQKDGAIVDRETGTRWSLEGVGEDGPLKGKQLKRIESHLSQWYGWSAYFPATSIYGRSDPPQPGDPVGL